MSAKLGRMLDFGREIAALEAGGRLDATTVARLRAIERREIFSVYPELRALSWGGVMLVVAGAGVLVADNLDRIGPWSLVAVIAAAAAACYAYAAWRRTTAAPSLVDDSVLLLGALLLSADLGYVETRLSLLDQGWPRHLLVLTFVHGAFAYVFGSRALLALSLSSLAAWIGVEQRLERAIDALSFRHTDTALRAYLCAAIVVGWRVAHQRAGGARDFHPVFDHVVANLALFGSLVLTFDPPSRLAGAIATLAVAAAVTVYGMRRQSETFVLYAYVYAVVAIDVLAIAHQRSFRAAVLYLLISTVAAIVGLFTLHSFYRRRTS